MITRIEKIGESQSVEYTGDVYVTGNIGKNANIKIKNGSLLVDGYVGAEVQITLIKKSTSSLLDPSSPFMVIPETNVHITGSIAEKVTIKAPRANVTVNGTIGCDSKICIRHGTICVTNIGKNVLLQTYNGDINCRDIGDEAVIKTHIGIIHARAMGKRAQALTHHGDIHIDRAESSVQLTTFSGCIYKMGIELKDREEAIWGKRARLPLVTQTEEPTYNSVPSWGYCL